VKGAIGMTKFSIGDEQPDATLCGLRIEGAIGWLELRRPDVFNALNFQLINEIIQLIKWSAERSVGARGTLLDSDGEEFLRVIIMSGEGKHFCAGADINMMRDAGAKTAEENRTDSERLDRLFNSLWSHPCFTIGCIQGVALGGGAGLIACLDHVIVEPGVKIALSEGKLGILPAVIGPYVYRRLGSAQFRRLAMLAKRIEADEALRIGMVDETVANRDELIAAAKATADEVLTTGPAAVTAAKRLTLTFDRWNTSDEELRLWTLDETSAMRGSPEGQEGLASFLEKRDAAWKIKEDK